MSEIREKRTIKVLFAHTLNLLDIISYDDWWTNHDVFMAFNRWLDES